MTTWHKGPPPSLGWWPASDRRNPDVLRWWNGEAWSAACLIGRSPQMARVKANTPHYGGAVEWRARPDNWPERSKT